MEQPERKRQIQFHPQQPKSERKGFALTNVYCSVWTKSNSLWKTKSPILHLEEKEEKVTTKNPTHTLSMCKATSRQFRQQHYFFFKKNKSLNNCQTMVHNV